MLNEEPKEVLWLVAGNEENEGMIPIMEKYRSLSNLLNTRHVLVTNSKNYNIFQGSTYFFDPGTKQLSLPEKYKFLVNMADMHGLFDSADMMVIGGFYPVVLIMAYAIDCKMTSKTRKFCTKPIIVMNPKIPEGELSDINPIYLDPFWWMLGHYDNITLAVGQLKNEMYLAKKYLLKFYPRAKVKQTLLPFVEYTYDDSPWSEKEDKVIWTGRYNSLKQLDLALKTLVLLESVGIKTEMYVPTAKASNTGKVRKAQKLLSEVNFNLDRESFWQKAGSAKVILITPLIEGFGTGMMEIISRGVIPVIWGAKWNRDYISPDEDWPLVFKLPGEGAEMCKLALKDYDYYARLLRDNLKKRYSRGYDWEFLLKGVWKSHINGRHSEEFSLEYKIYD